MLQEEAGLRLHRSTSSSSRSFNRAAGLNECCIGVRRRDSFYRQKMKTRVSKVCNCLAARHRPNTTAVFPSPLTQCASSSGRLLRCTLECCSLCLIFWMELLGPCTSLMLMFLLFESVCFYFLNSTNPLFF